MNIQTIYGEALTPDLVCDLCHRVQARRIVCLIGFLIILCQICELTKGLNPRSRATRLYRFRVDPITPIQLKIAFGLTLYS